jgi:hypothetical protein
VRSAQDGVIFRVGGRKLVLCTTHTRLAQAAVTIMGAAAVRGIEQVLEARNPEAVRALRRAGEFGDAIGTHFRSTTAALEPDAVFDEPARQRVKATVQRARGRHEDVIEGEFVEVKP